MSTSVSSFRNRTTPGVYETEIAAFGTAIVGVPTAVPVFIGYTEFAGDPLTGNPLYNMPVPISSMAEFERHFGRAAPQNFVIAVTPPPPTPGGSGTPAESGQIAVAPTPSFRANFTTPVAGSAPPGGNGFQVASTGFTLSPAPPVEPNQFNLYWQMRLFYANGGGDCYVVSVGSYWTTDSPPTSAQNPVPDLRVLALIEKGDPDAEQPVPGLLTGLAAAGYAVGPTMTVIPEACQLARPDYEAVVQAMLDQAMTLQDRVAIIDLQGCMAADTLPGLQAGQAELATAIAPSIAAASYGVAYAPALNTSIIGVTDILFTNLVAADGGDNSVMNNILTTQAHLLYGPAQVAALQPAIAAAFPVTGAANGANTPQYSGSSDGYKPALDPTSPASVRQWQTRLDNLLLNALPVFGQIEQQIANVMNVAPPSGLIAGIWNKSDVLHGVWNAPANMALSAVASPLYNMSDAEQGTFNVPTNGQAIDIIRVQPGRGNVVWGARTLDGNSLDYRYVQVRRTLIYIEQSIKVALQSYVFAANDATTWTTVVAAISGFLTNLWQAGGLVGTKPDDAFTVTCGVGSTMTSQDVLNGYMIVAVTLQMVHPAEFIELTFTQTMGS